MGGCAPRGAQRDCPPSSPSSVAEEAAEGSAYCPIAAASAWTRKPSAPCLRTRSSVSLAPTTPCNPWSPASGEKLPGASPETSSSPTWTGSGPTSCCSIFGIKMTSYSPNASQPPSIFSPSFSTADRIAGLGVLDHSLPRLGPCTPLQQEV